MATRRLSMTPGESFLTEGPEGRRAEQLQSKNRLLPFFDSATRRFRNATASQFIDVWNYFDVDGNGFIDGDELEMFLIKLVECILPDGASKSLCEEEEKELVKELMAAIDTNKDNRIDLREMAQLLPTDEEFLVIFQDDYKIRSSIEFMKIWKEFDKDHSGYIEADELKSFLALLMGPSMATVETFEEKLMEYTDAILNLFDINGDGKLQLSEMSRLLPAKENFLCRPIFKKKGCITSDDIEHVFKFYDADHNGTIENDELYGFLKDLLELTNQDYDDSDLAFTKAAILKDWDLNHDGKISLAEMRMLLLAYSINEGKPRTHLQVDPQSAFWRRRRRSSNRQTKAQSTTHREEL